MAEPSQGMKNDQECKHEQSNSDSNNNTNNNNNNSSSSVKNETVIDIITITTTIIEKTTISTVTATLVPFDAKVMIDKEAGKMATTTTTVKLNYKTAENFLEKNEKEVEDLPKIITTTTKTTTEVERNNVLTKTTIKVNENMQEIQQTEAIDKLSQSKIYCNNSNDKQQSNATNLHEHVDKHEDEDDLKTRYGSNTKDADEVSDADADAEAKQQLQQKLNSFCSEMKRHSNIAHISPINIGEMKVKQHKVIKQNDAETATLATAATAVAAAAAIAEAAKTEAAAAQAKATSLDKDLNDKLDQFSKMLQQSKSLDEAAEENVIEKATLAANVGVTNVASSSRNTDSTLTTTTNANVLLSKEREPKEEMKSREELLSCLRDVDVGQSNNCSEHQEEDQSHLNSLAKKSVVDEQSFRDLTKAVSGCASNETQHVVKIHVNSSGSSNNNNNNINSNENSVTSDNKLSLIDSRDEHTSLNDQQTLTTRSIIKGKQVSVINLNGKNEHEELKEEAKEKDKTVLMQGIQNWQQEHQHQHQHLIQQHQLQQHQLQQQEQKEKISLKPEQTKLHLKVNSNRTTTMVMLQKANSQSTTTPSPTPSLTTTTINTEAVGGAVTVATNPICNMQTSVCSSSSSSSSSLSLGSSGVCLGGSGGNHSGTSITELNSTTTLTPITNTNSTPYHYYVVSSGQFSPCETLDSGTGSDLDNNNSNTVTTASTVKSSKNSKLTNESRNLPTTIVDIVNVNNEKKIKQKLKKDSELVPDVEVFRTTTCIRMNSKKLIKTKSKSKLNQNPLWTNTSGSKTIINNNNNTNSGAMDETNANLQRAYSLTDSEESENLSTSSLSCDSLHSGEYAGHHQQQQQQQTHGHHGAFLPDSLLRDIRDRKFATNDFVHKYGAILPTSDATPQPSSTHDGLHHNDGDDDNESLIYDVTTPSNKKSVTKLSGKISTTTLRYKPLTKGRQPSSNEFYVDSQEDEDEDNEDDEDEDDDNDNDNDDENKNQQKNAINIKKNPYDMEHSYKYEADKFYVFHVKEHENFRSFGNNTMSPSLINNNNSNHHTEDGIPASRYESTTSIRADEAFAGYKDIRCKMASSTIRSARGTVRGVKNRVRNGIATFLQLQQPNIKNYKEKDMGKVVLYTTSMGIIRDTYAKCTNIKKILRTLLIKFEERDVFMSIEYQQEIRDRMNSAVISVPQLFVEGQHIGDADAVERMNESGELRQLLKPYKSIATTFTCQTCGGYRLLPCPSCNGSKKSVHRNHFTAEFVALKCMNCDEVGLVKCHNC